MQLQQQLHILEQQETVASIGRQNERLAVDCYRAKMRAEEAEERAKDAENQCQEVREEAARQALLLRQEAADERAMEGKVE